MRRFSYLSECTCNSNDVGLLRLIRSCDAFNPRYGITGRLAITPTHFLQTVEGDAFTISKLSGRILSDSRHKNLFVISDHDTCLRRYDNFEIQFFRRPELVPETFVTADETETVADLLRKDPVYAA